MAEHTSALAHHFDTLDQQHRAQTLGMWAFLAQEVMFFGGLFAGYAVYRTYYPQAFASGSHHLDVTLGTINTFVLIGSSLTMAFGVRCAQLSQRGGLVASLWGTIILGTAFLGVKAFEYAHKFHEQLIPGRLFVRPDSEPPQLEMFFTFYFLMTGAHALHMVIGIGILGVLLVKAYRGKLLGDYFAPVEFTGLYWHFVDIVWIFLFPLLYLLGRH